MSCACGEWKTSCGKRPTTTTLEWAAETRSHQGLIPSQKLHFLLQTNPRNMSLSWWIVLFLFLLTNVPSILAIRKLKDEFTVPKGSSIPYCFIVGPNRMQWMHEVKMKLHRHKYTYYLFISILVFFFSYSPPTILPSQGGKNLQNILCIFSRKKFILYTYISPNIIYFLFKMGI